MQSLVPNLHGTRAFDRKAGRVVSLALTVGLLGALAAAPASARPQPASMTKMAALPVPDRAAPGDPNDVTLDFVAADINDVLKALAMQTGTNIVSGSDVKGTITVSLAHVSLEEALDLISKLSGFQYAKVGKTYLVGTPAAIATMTQSGTAQAPATTGVITFNYSDPTDLGNIIKQMYPNIKTTPGKSAGNASGGVLIVTGTQDEVEGIRRVVADAESALSKNIAASRTEIYNIKYASADDLQSVLSRLVPGIIVTPGPTQRAIPPAPTTADSSGATSTTTSYGNTGAGTGGTVTSATGNLPTKPTTNSLLLTGSDADIARARQILTTVDLRPAQINFEAKVSEVNLNSLKQIGLKYDFTGASAIIGEFGTTNTLGSGTYAGKVNKFGTFGRTPLSNFVTVGLDALYTSGDAKLLANRNISAIDGQPAAVFIGDTINYISSVTQSPTGQNITTSSVNAGIKLFVTGKVNNDGYITMNVHPEVSLVTLQNAGIGGAQLPRISTREATTTVRVRDGDTIAISGLINEQDTKDVRKVPFLGDIPFIGNLFRDTTHNHNRDEVVIFIKVSIQKEPV
ncbi:MAG: hypothetical protein M3Y13_13235 [Armatimonadota bacterium]|nr:hypothetical protein [Armatimonadota bacterium]